MAVDRLRIGVLDVESGQIHGTWIQEQVQEKHPDLKVVIRALGAKPRHKRAAKSGHTVPIRAFYSEPIYEALIASKVDVGVHRMKDLPSTLPEGVALEAVCERKTPLDVLVTTDGSIIDELPRGAHVGVSSLRRQAQLARYRPDLELVFVVGTLSERLHMVDSGKLQGIVVAASGIEWRGWQERVSEVFTAQVCTPAVGQAALGLLVREGNEEIGELVRFLNHTLSQREVTAERSFHHSVGAWEGAPIGALARVKGDILKIEGCVCSLDGQVVLRDRAEGFPDDPIRTGERLAKSLLEQGAAAILEEQGVEIVE